MKLLPWCGDQRGQLTTGLHALSKCKFCVQRVPHRLHRQIHSWKSEDVRSRHPWIFQWSGICCASITMSTEGWGVKRGQMKVKWDLLLGSAVGLAQASNTTFTSADQEPFQHRVWCCPEFRTHFLSLPSPPYHYKSGINAVCYQCPSPSTTSVGSFGSAEVVVPYLWRHLNFWLLSSAFLKMADIQFQST